MIFNQKEIGSSTSLIERKGDKAVKTVLVNIPGGICGCSYFQKSLIPCKHMFAIFTHFPSDWSWKNLPPSLTESSYMTLDIAVLHSDEVTEVLNDSNLEQTTMEEMDTSNETPDPPAKQTNAHQLLLAQRQARDALSKCISVIFSLENLWSYSVSYSNGKSALLPTYSGSTSMENAWRIAIISTPGQSRG